jgi:hypothetical protein
LNNPAALLAIQAVLPPRHFACSAGAGAAGTSISVVTSAVPIERLVMCPSDVAAIKETEGGQADASKATAKHDWNGCVNGFADFA